MTDPPPLHLRPALLGVVLAGGAVGTAAREALSLAIPDVGDLPLAILVINVAGAFVLGVLLEALQRRGADEGRRRTLRLGLGTGFCGGFTTYSTLAVGVGELLRSGSAGIGVAYGVGSVVLGAVAAWFGILVGSRR
ncbi:fluoride efflux transporter FluC [Amnibacterium setariae]|uniref:Fluoride-specific ion channel FluC n=1 Tax=Amnibacterium setariae TaxID=2306585 RepID=A0A3A1U1B1_9MICO|nr:CrcB family protein [Amnibacterium setariae]RIX28725.1 CrcB family protein [Amnibacterium setariae]